MLFICLLSLQMACVSRNHGDDYGGDPPEDPNWRLQGGCQSKKFFKALTCI